MSSSKVKSELVYKVMIFKETEEHSPFKLLKRSIFILTVTDALTSASVKMRRRHELQHL
jgi:hypothetical protein